MRRMMMKAWARAEVEAEAAEVGSGDGGCGGGETENAGKSFKLLLRGGISWRKVWSLFVSNDAIEGQERWIEEWWDQDYLRDTVDTVAGSAASRRLMAPVNMNID